MFGSGSTRAWSFPPRLRSAAAGSLCLALALLLQGCSPEVVRRYEAPRDPSHLDALLSWLEVAGEEPGGQRAETGSRVTYDYRISYADGPLIQKGQLTTVVFGHSHSELEGALAHGLGEGGSRLVHLPADAPLHCDMRVCLFDGVPYRRDRGDFEVEIALGDVCVPHDLILMRGSGILGESSIPWRCL